MGAQKEFLTFPVRGALLLALLVAGTIPGTQAQEPLTLTVIVSGAEPGTGQAMSSLFDSQETYMKAPALERIVPIDDTGRARWTFEGLAPGWFAVAVIYDEDMDGELDTGFLGIPRELIGMSNNARGRFGPPKWDKTRFELTEDQTIEIRFGKAKE